MYVLCTTYKCVQVPNNKYCICVNAAKIPHPTKPSFRLDKLARLGKLGKLARLGKLGRLGWARFLGWAGWASWAGSKSAQPRLGWGTISPTSVVGN